MNGTRSNALSNVGSRNPILRPDEGAERIFTIREQEFTKLLAQHRTSHQDGFFAEFESQSLASSTAYKASVSAGFTPRGAYYVVGSVIMVAEGVSTAISRDPLHTKAMFGISYRLLGKEASFLFNVPRDGNLLFSIESRMHSMPFSDHELAEDAKIHARVLARPLREFARPSFTC